MSAPLQGCFDTSTEARFPVTRAAALRRLRAFVPHAGAEYARLRNIDQGTCDHQHVSRLSAALRRRVLTEAEVAQAVIAHHGMQAGGKFLSEIFWRSYFKGWLEQRPAVWPAYLATAVAARAAVAADLAQAARYGAACAGQTGIDCFDHWLTEMVQTGYLHNWARMQLASIWVHTLHLPWALGAELTLRHFNDADPASNTLSWRWVAGLHTKGKAYLADPALIAQMTDGRFAPHGLARTATIPQDDIDAGVAAPRRAHDAPDPARATMLLLTVEDLTPQTEALMTALDIRAIAALPVTGDFDRRAMTDAATLAGARWQQPAFSCTQDAQILARARAAGCTQIATMFAPVGPTAARLDALRADAARQGIRLAEHLRDWDRRTWPHCRKGFFKLKERIPALLDAAELSEAAP